MNNLKKFNTKRRNNWEATGVVSFRDANVKEFPSEVQGIAASVRVVDATNNRITQLPSYLVAFSSLQRLVLSKNALTHLPPELGALHSLKVLLLDDNQLSALPDSVGRLGRLERLSVRGNSIGALPHTLGALTSLRLLDVAGNKLKQVPEELGGCRSLEEVDAADNYLQSIPPSLSSLQHLKTLTLDSNRIMAVPPAVLQECGSLQTLSLHNNPVTVKDLEATEGWAAFEARRKSKFDKSIGAGVLLDSKGLDEGVDRQR